MNGSCSLEQIIQFMVVNGYRLPPSTQFNLDKRPLSKLGRTFCQPFSDLSLWKTGIRALKNAFTKRSDWVREKERRKSTDQVYANWTDTQLLSPNHSYLQQHNRVFYCDILSKVWAAQTAGWPVSTPVSKPPSNTLKGESTGEGCSVTSDSLWPHGLYRSWNSSGQNIGVGSLSFLQRIFPTQDSHTVGDSLPAEPEGKPKNTEVGNLSLLQWIFPTQESKCSLLHGRQILYQLNYLGSPWKSQGNNCNKLLRCMESI